MDDHSQTSIWKSHKWLKNPEINDFYDYEDMAANGRSPVELIVKTVAIQLACLLAWGHLLTLQGHNVRSQKWHVIWAILAPMQPFALAVFMLVKTIRNFIQSRARTVPVSSSQVFGLSYYLGTICGVSAKVTGSSKTVLMYLIPPTSPHLSRIRESRDLRWFARFLPMILLLSQCIGFFCQFARRIECSIRYQHFVPHYFGPSKRKYSRYDDWMSPEKYADSPVDYLNLFAVVGGFTSVSMSIIIWASNSSWTIREENIADPQPPSILGTRDFKRILALTIVMELAAQSHVIGIYYILSISGLIFFYRKCIYEGYPGLAVVVLSVLILILGSASGAFIAIFAAGYRYIPSRRWRQTVESIAKFKLSPSLELGDLAFCMDHAVVVLLFLRRIWMFYMMVITFIEMYYCGPSIGACGCPLYMWKDSLFDKLYTF